VLARADARRARSAPARSSGAMAAKGVAGAGSASERDERTARRSWGGRAARAGSILLRIVCAERSGTGRYSASPPRPSSARESPAPARVTPRTGSRGGRGDKGSRGGRGDKGSRGGTVVGGRLGEDVVDAGLEALALEALAAVANPRPKVLARPPARLALVVHLTAPRPRAPAPQPRAPAPPRPRAPAPPRPRAPAPPRAPAEAPFRGRTGRRAPPPRAASYAPAQRNVTCVC